MFDWSAEIIADWLERGHPHMTDGLNLFPSERGTLISETALNRRFNRYCEDLGLSPGLDIHSLRRSYVTHLIEARMDSLFVQHQAGHEHASTMVLYASRLQRLPGQNAAPGLGLHRPGCPCRNGRLNLMKREIDYRWRLAELMAARGMHNSTGTCLAHDDRRPLRHSPADPRTWSPSRQQTPKVRKVASDANVVDLNKTIRPKRARVIRDDG